MNQKTKWSLISVTTLIAYVSLAELYLFASLNHWQVNDWLQVNASILVAFGWIGPLVCIGHTWIDL